MKKVLITGANGLLGTSLSAEARARGMDVYALSHRELNIVNPKAVDKTVLNLKPEVIFNCAAYSDVDGAETARQTALNVNSIGPGNLAWAAGCVGALLVHISSDFVFDGAKKSPYIPADSTNPLNFYGMSKRWGEELVEEQGEEWLIIRTSWLYGENGKGFMPFVRKNLGTLGKALPIVADQISSPTWVGHLAPIVLDSVDNRGYMHLTNEGECTRFEWATFIQELAKNEVRRGLYPISATEFGAVAVRPGYSVLKSTSNLPHWKEGMIEFLKREGAVLCQQIR